MVSSKDWHIHFREGAPVRNIVPQLDAALASLEAAGIEQFFGPLAQPGSAVWRLHSEGGVESGHALPTLNSRISIAPVSSPGGFSGGANATDAARTEWTKADNRRKLRSAITPERHLAVYIDTGYYLPWRAMCYHEPPDVSPDLPDEITHIWVFTEFREDACVVWHAKSGERWKTLGVVPLPPLQGSPR